MKTDRTRMRLASRMIVALMLTFPFLLVVALALVFTELWLRKTTNLPFLSRSRCFTQSRAEAPGFLPGCDDQMRTPLGPVPFRTNELGFRDRPLAQFRAGAVAVLGDSHVEGFWLREEQGLVRQLELAARWPFPLLNLGIRASGPSQQAIRLFRAWKELPLKGAVWVLNPSDPLDERLFLARNPGFRLSRAGWPDLSPSWDLTPAYRAFTKLSLALGDRSYLLLYVAERWIKQRSQTSLIERGGFEPSQHCRSLELAASELRKAGLPLVFVAIPHGLTAEARSYLGLPVSGPGFDQLLACARATGYPLLDFRKELGLEPGWFWKNDWHLNAEGVRAAAGAMAPRILAEWKVKK